MPARKQGKARHGNANYTYRLFEHHNLGGALLLEAHRPPRVVAWAAQAVGAAGGGSNPALTQQRRFACRARNKIPSSKHQMRHFPHQSHSWGRWDQRSRPRQTPAGCPRCTCRRRRPSSHGPCLRGRGVEGGREGCEGVQGRMRARGVWHWVAVVWRRGLPVCARYPTLLFAAAGPAGRCNAPHAAPARSQQHGCRAACRRLQQQQQQRQRYSSPLPLRLRWWSCARSPLVLIPSLCGFLPSCGLPASPPSSPPRPAAAAGAAAARARRGGQGVCACVRARSEQKGCVREPKGCYLWNARHPGSAGICLLSGARCELPAHMRRAGVRLPSLRCMLHAGGAEPSTRRSALPGRSPAGYARCSARFLDSAASRASRCSASERPTGWVKRTAAVQGGDARPTTGARATDLPSGSSALGGPPRWLACAWLRWCWGN